MAVNNATEPHSSEAVLFYIRAKRKAELAKQTAVDAANAHADAERDMQAAWWHCKNATPGVYSFEEMGRVAVVVDPLRDYPALTVIVP